VLNDIFSAVIQVLVFALIPLIVWAIVAREKENFFSWIGLRKIKTEDPFKFVLLFIALFIGVCLISIWVVPLIVTGEGIAANQFQGKGVSAIPGILIHSVIQTGLSEEILFRGFIGKRLVSRLGFAPGNLIQAGLFGLMHGALFFTMIGWERALGLTLLTGGIGWIEGWLNEKRAGGSILPSWIFHSLTNIASGIGAAFG
jgi:membrane protease YdiL (CAAX protease family)